MSRLNRLSLVLTLRCEDASVLTSRELDESLPGLEQVALLTHVVLCRSCRRFRKQVRLIRKAVRNRARLVTDTNSIEGRLSVDARDRIARVCREIRRDGEDTEYNRGDWKE